MPSSPSGWLRWSCYVLEAQGRPFSPRFDHIPRTDPRLRDSKETALSVKLILERITNGNGAGKLLVDYYVHEASWWSFTGPEQAILRKTARRFRQALAAAGFLPGEGDGATPGGIVDPGRTWGVG